MYRYFERTGDALVSELQAPSLPQLSLLVFCERSFASVYEALQRKTHLLIGYLYYLLEISESIGATRSSETERGMDGQAARSG
jgi:hypothetical protein